MSNCCMRRHAKFHVDSSVRFLAIANIREGGRQTPPPPVKRGLSLSLVKGSWKWRSGIHCFQTFSENDIFFQKMTHQNFIYTISLRPLPVFMGDKIIYLRFCPSNFSSWGDICRSCSPFRRPCVYATYLSCFWVSLNEVFITKTTYQYVDIPSSYLAPWILGTCEC